MIKFIGSDYQTQPVNTQMQDGKLLDIPQIADASANSIRQSIGEVQRINSAASNADAEAVGRRVVTQPQQGGGVVDAITGLAKVGMSFYENQQKAEAAQAEKEFIIESEKLAANAPDLISKTNEGGVGYQTRAEQLAAKYAPKISADLLNKQLLRMYSPIQQFQEKDADTLRKEAEKIRDANTEVFVKTQSLNLDTQMADLENVKDPVERQTKVNNVLKIFSDSLVTSNLSSPQKVYATSAFLNIISKSSVAGSQTGAKFLDRIRTINETNEFIARTENLPDDQKVQQRLARYATLDPDLKGVYGQILDPSQVRKQEMEDLRNAQALNEAVRRNEMDAAKAFQLTNDATTSLMAWYVNADGAARASFREQYKDIPAFQAVVSGANDYLKDRDKKIELQRESGRLAEAIAGLGKSDAKERLSWVNQAYQLPNLSLSSDIVPQLQNVIKTLEAAQRRGVPEEVQKAQQDVEKYNAVLLDALKARAAQVNQLFKDTDAPWTALEQNIRDPQKQQLNSQKLRETLDSYNQSVQQRRQSILRGTNPNFNMPQLAELQVGEVKLPLPFKAGTQVSYSGDYGVDRGSHTHAGVDISVAENTPLIAPISGVIASAMQQSDYGNFIDVRTPDGKILRYAHLNRMDVKEGDTVLAGQVIGLTGSTGRSTGAHLHFEVRNDLYGGYEKTEDPIAWSVKNLSNANRGLNARRGANVPDNLPPNAFPLSGAYLLDGKIHRDNGTVDAHSYSARSPIRNIPLPADKNVYSSSPDKNYGYAELANNAPFRRELHRVAKSLNTPAQWLADAIAFETAGTFAAGIDNNQGYTGLIQFGDEAAKDVGTTRAALAQMTNTEQLKYVERFLKMRSEAYGLKYDKPEAITMGIWGRVVDIQNYVKDPQLVRDVRDSNISFGDYVKRLGEHAGRRYQTSYDPQIATPIHNTYRSSCLTCQGLVRAGMGFIPHQAP